MKMVQDPGRFDVLLMENLYGDVVSDLCAGLVGGLGWCRGRTSAIGRRCSKPCTARRPIIAGRGIANPLALLMSAVMMLNHIAETEKDPGARAVAARVRDAYDRALRDGQHTRDLGGTLGTDAFAASVVERM